MRSLSGESVREWTRETRLFLRNWVVSPGDTWGFAVYRTVYTKKSDLHWGEIMSKLDDYVRWEAMHELEEQDSDDEALDPGPNRIVADTFKNVIIQDAARFDHASLDFVRARFNEYIRDHWNDDHTKSRWITTPKVCIVVDEEVFEELLKAPRNKHDLFETDREFCVKLVDGVYDGLNRGLHAYAGWVKVDVREMITVFETVWNNELMSRAEEGKDGVYYYD